MTDSKHFTFSVIMTSEPICNSDNIWFVTGKDADNTTYDIDFSVNDVGIADYIRVKKTGVDNNGS